MIDEPLVVPATPGACLARLAQIEGALHRHAPIAHLIAPESDAALPLKTAREELTRALGEGFEAVRPAFESAQNTLRRLYETACRPGLFPPEDAPAWFAALGLPDPLEKRVQPIDVTTVLATHFMPQRQVMTTIAFEHAPGATHYWLRETRFLRGERLEDFMVEAQQPIFARLRLPVGAHIFQVQSRDSSHHAMSEEFSVDVPQL